MTKYQLDDFPIPVHKGKTKNYIKKVELQEWSEKFFKNVHKIEKMSGIGLCFVLSYCSKNISILNVINKYCKTWEHFSEHILFPINITTCSASLEYATYPHWEGDQLKAREDLMNHILKSMKKFEYLE